MPNLLPILADFLTTAQGAYPDLDATAGSSCVLLRWGSHTLTAWVDLEVGSMMITSDQSCENYDGGPEPLDTVAEMLAERVQAAEREYDPNDARPGTFAARVWVAYYRSEITVAEEWIARLDPEGRYSVKQSAPSSINLADFAKALDPDDTLF